MRLTDRDDRRRLRRVLFGTLIPIILAITLVFFYRAARGPCAFDAPEPSYVCATAAFNGENR